MGSACLGRGRHAQSAPTIAAACPARYHVRCTSLHRCALQKWMPSLFPLSLAPSLPLPRSLATRVRHGRHHRASRPPLLPSSSSQPITVQPCTAEPQPQRDHGPPSQPADQAPELAPTAQFVGAAVARGWTFLAQCWPSQSPVQVRVG